MVNIKPNRAGVITLVLAVLLIVAVGYISFDKYQTTKDTQLRTVYQQGYDLGITASVVSIFQQTEQCQVVNLNAVDEEGNPVQKQLMDVACLRTTSPQAQQGQQE